MDKRVPLIKILLRRLRRKPVPTAFIGGDASGAVFVNVGTDAENFTNGGKERGRHG